MDRKDMPGSGWSDVSRGVLRSRPRRVEKQKLGAVGLIVVLGATGFADVSHRIAAGDNLTKIAGKYGVSVRSIAANNKVANPDFIRKGTVLRIPGPASKGIAAGGGSQAAGKLINHRVAAGDNLTRIAARYRTTVATLVSINRIRNPAVVRIGQNLRVPGPAAGGVAGPVSPPATGVISQVAPKLGVPIHPVNLPPKPPTTTVSSPEPAGVGKLIEAFSGKYGVSPALMKGLAWQESGWKQHVVSSAGAIGIMQVLPQTGDFVARHLLKRPVDLNDPQQNVEAGIAFFAFYLSKTSGDERTAVAGYFQGLRSVWQSGVSERTKKYVEAVLALRGRFGT